MTERKRPGPTPKAKAPDLSKKRRTQYSQAAKDLAVASWRSGKHKTQSDLITHLKALPVKGRDYTSLTQSVFSRWLSQAEGAVSAGAANPFSGGRKTFRSREVRFPRLEEALIAWMDKRDALGQQMTLPLIREKALRFRAILSIKPSLFKASAGWLNQFRHRRRHGESAVEPVETIKAERQRCQELFRDKDPADILNADECALFWKQGGNGNFTWTRKDKVANTKVDKARISILVTTSATGERFPLLFIGKFKSPRPFKKRTPRQLGIDYYNNSKAWMNRIIFRQWLELIDRTAKRKRHFQIITDGFKGHFVDTDDLKNLTLHIFTANLTPWVQPDDAGIIRCLKAGYRRLTLIRSLDLEDEGADDIFEINILEAMKLMQDAWEDVSAQTIVNCWHHTQILPGSTKPTDDQVDLADDPELDQAVVEMQVAVSNVEKALDSRKGARKNAGRPSMVVDTEDLLADAPEPDWGPLDDDEESIVNELSELRVESAAEPALPAGPPLDKCIEALATLRLFCSSSSEADPAIVNRLSRIIPTTSLELRRLRNTSLRSTTLDDFFSAATPKSLSKESTEEREVENEVRYYIDGKEM
ncbi:hypothetical protein RQP46_001402 [Phenoliferia psychrophenolica]